MFRNNHTLSRDSNKPSCTRKQGLITKWYIPSEKIGQFFWPPRNGFFGINYHQWTWGNAFWPFLAPPDPWGVSGGVGGGQGGSVGPKFSTFRGATFGFQNVKFWIVWTENTLFSRFLAKNSPSGGQKWPFLAKMGVDKSAFFSKTPSLNCLKMHHNKVLGSILMWEKFGPAPPSKIFHDGKIRILARSDPSTGGNWHSHPWAIKNASNL